MAISPQQVVRSTSCLVLGQGFRGRCIVWIYFRLNQMQVVVAGLHAIFRINRVSDQVIVIGIRFLNYSLNFMYVMSDTNILFSHRSFIFDVS